MKENITAIGDFSIYGTFYAIFIIAKHGTKLCHNVETEFALIIKINLSKFAYMLTYIYNNVT